MPGPCSAPNGNGNLVDRHPEKQKGNINTGKTDLKHKKIQHVRKRSKPTRAQVQKMNEDDLNYLTGHGTGHEK